MTVIHDTAWVSPQADVAPDVEIGPYCVIYENTVIGAGTVLHNNVTVFPRTAIGTRNRIFPGASLGGAPQDLKYKGGQTRLEVGDDNVIRECVTMNAGTEKGGGITRVGSRNLFMACSHVAHDCQFADDIIVGNNVLPAGHVTVGRKVVLSGGCAMHHFTTIGEFAFVGGLTRIVHDVPPYMITEGNPSKVRAVNVVGMQRGGFDETVVEQMREAYRLLFMTGKKFSRKQAVKKILDWPDPCKQVRYLVDFLQASEGGKHGRQHQP
ncbi:MAG: acyl-ACP--UDP-N-acetylglucosamine O-acyltransferase [Planctomycetota bacterium]